MKEMVLISTMWVVTICTYISYMPQIVKIIKTKSSEDISVWSWILWTTSALCNVVYSFVLGRSELIFAGVSELVLTALVLALSFVYKNKAHTIQLCEVDVYVGNQEWYILNCVVNSWDTKKDVLLKIAKECTVPAVLHNIVSSDNPNITDEIRENAKNNLKIQEKEKERARKELLEKHKLDFDNAVN